MIRDGLQVGLKTPGMSFFFVFLILLMIFLQVLLELKPPCGPVFPAFCGGEDGHSHRANAVEIYCMSYNVLYDFFVCIFLLPYLHNHSLYIVTHIILRSLNFHTKLRYESFIIATLSFIDSVCRSGPVQFFDPKMGNQQLQPVA